MTEDADQRSVRVAARRTALWTSVVAAAIVFGSLGLAALFVVYQSRPSELLERAKPGQDKIYVDSNEMLMALAVLGALAVGAVGLTGWRASRSAVAPLGAALRMQRAFVADASHELRTPLAVLDTRLQLLQRRLDQGEPVDEAVGEARRDVARMTELVTDLLLTAEEAASDAAGTGADLRTAVLSSVDDLRVLADELDVRLVAEVDDDARLPLSEAGLRRSVVVLVDNAIAHSPTGAAVRVRAVVERDRAVIRVGDEGGGITGVAPERVFERFAHGESAGRRRGFGIGLSLARDLAVRHGGDVAVERTGPAGTVMRLELPVVR